MQRKDVGRVLRAYPLSARALTEIQVRRLLRSEVFADLRHCVRLAQPGSTAVDVGASVGNYSVAMSKAVGAQGAVIALEANPAVFKELVASTWRAHVDARNIAASSSSGTAVLTVPADAQGRAIEPLGTLEHRGEGVTVSVPCVRLDELLEAATRVSVIKIDVEGHEYDVLQGATQTLDRHRPPLVIEIESQHQTGGRTVGDVVEFLTDRGYTAVGIHGAELIPWAEYDLDRWQMRWLAADDTYRSEHKVDYVNNFLFT